MCDTSDWWQTSGLKQSKMKQSLQEFDINRSNVQQHVMPHLVKIVKTRRRMNITHYSEEKTFYFQRITIEQSIGEGYLVLHGLKYCLMQ